MIQGTVQLGLPAFADGAHGPFQHLGVEGEAHFVNLAALVFAQQFPGAANLEIVGGQGETRAQVFQGLQGLQALHRVPGHGFGWRSNEIGVGAVMGAAHPAAQLVQLGQAQLVGAVDDDGVGRGHVDAALDDGGGHQDVETLVVEIAHDAFQLALAHLSVGEIHPRARHQFLDIRHHARHAGHVVVQHIDLAAALQLALAGLADDHVVPLLDEGLDGLTPGRGRGDNGQVAHAGHGHVQGAGNGGGGEGEDVHLGAQGLEALLVTHAEAVLLVDDDQPQVLERDALAENLVGAHHDVDGAVLQALESGIDLFAGVEAGQGGDFHRPVGETVGKVLVMLLGQESGGHQDGHLFAALGGHEGGAHGYLCLAETHVAADHPVHGAGRAHVGNDVFDGFFLVRGFLEFEFGGELAVFLAGGREGEPLAGFPAGVNFQQLGGGVAHFARGLPAGLFPLVAAQAVQGGVLFRGAGIAADEMQRRHGHVELVAPGVFQGEEFHAHAAHVQVLQPQVTAHAMILMHHGRADLQFRQVAHHLVGVRAGLAPFAGLAHPFAQEQGFRNDGQGGLAQLQAFFQGRHGDGQGRLLMEEVGEAVHLPGAQAEARQGIEQMLPAPGALGGEQYRAAASGQIILQQARRTLGPGLNGQGRQGAGVEVAPAGKALAPLVHAAPAPADAGMGLDAVYQFVAVQVQPRRRQQGTLDVVTALLVAFFHLFVEMAGILGQVVALDDEGVPAQIVEQGGGLFEEQGQVVFQAAGKVALAHFPVDEAGLGIALELVAVLTAEKADGVLVHGKLTGGEQADTVHLFGRALGFGVEQADAVDFVVEQVDAVGAFRAHGKQVEEGTAHGKLAMFHDLGHAVVASPFQAPAKGIDFQRIAAVQHQAVGVQVIRRQYALLGRGGWHDEYALAGLLQLVQGQQALGHQFRQGREQVIGQGFPVGKMQDGPLVPFQKKTELLLQAAGFLYVPGDDHHQAMPSTGGTADGQLQAGPQAAAPLQTLTGLVREQGLQGRDVWFLGGIHGARIVAQGRIFPKSRIQQRFRQGFLPCKRVQYRWRKHHEDIQEHSGPHFPVVAGSGGSRPGGRPLQQGGHSDHL